MAKKTAQKTAKTPAKSPAKGSKGIPFAEKRGAPAGVAPNRNCVLIGAPIYAAKNFNHDKKATGLDGAKPFEDWNKGTQKGIAPVLARMTEEGGGLRRTRVENATVLVCSPEDLRAYADECERKNFAEIPLVTVVDFALGPDRFNGDCVRQAGAEMLTLTATAQAVVSKRQAATEARLLLVESAAALAASLGWEIGGDDHKAHLASLLKSLEKAQS